MTMVQRQVMEASAYLNHVAADAPLIDEYMEKATKSASGSVEITRNELEVIYTLIKMATNAAGCLNDINFGQWCGGTNNGNS